MLEINHVAVRPELRRRVPKWFSHNRFERFEPLELFERFLEPVTAVKHRRGKLPKTVHVFEARFLQPRQGRSAA
jgi:hypothetical protein